MQITSVNTTDVGDSVPAAKTNDNANATLMASIDVSKVCIVSMIMLMYFASRRKQRSQSVIQEMQLIPHKEYESAQHKCFS